MVENKLNIAIFISGRGSNMAALIDACKDKSFPAFISCVISNNEDAPGLDIAKAAGIHTHVVYHKDFDRKQDFEQALLETLSDYEPDMVCLAGFMRVLSPFFLTHFKGDIINIHPSLLPKFKGLDTHERVIEAGEDKSGCSVHYVTAGVDEGEVILQRSVHVDSSDTPDQLAAKVLKEEHIAYPEAVRFLAEKKLEKQAS